MLNGIACCMAPSGVKKALSFEAVRLASHGPFRSAVLKGFVEQNEIVDVTKISSEDGILQRTGDQDSQGFHTGQGAAVFGCAGSGGAVGGSTEDGVSERSSSCSARAHLCEDLGAERVYHSGEDLKPRPDLAAYSGAESR